MQSRTMVLILAVSMIMVLSGSAIPIKADSTSLENKEDFRLTTSTYDQSLLVGSVSGYSLTAGDVLSISWKGNQSGILSPPRVYLLNDYQFHGWDYFRKYIFLDPASRGWLLRNDSWEMTLSYSITSSGIYYVIIDNPNWIPDIITPSIDIMSYQAVQNYPNSYYLTVKTDPHGIVSILGEGWYSRNYDKILTAPSQVVVNSSFQYRFAYWDADGIPYGKDVNPVTVEMNSNRTATAHYVLYRLLEHKEPFRVQTSTHEQSLLVGSISGYSLSAGDTMSVSWSGYNLWMASALRFYLLNQFQFDGWEWNIYLGGNPSRGCIMGLDSWEQTIEYTITSSGEYYVIIECVGVHYGTLPALLQVVSYDAFALLPKSYYLSVKTDPVGIVSVSGEGWYTEGSNPVLSAPIAVSVSSNTQYRFEYWDVDGVSRGMGVNSITVGMNANHTATAHYVLQYQARFDQTDLDSSAISTVVAVNNISKMRGDLPFVFWIDNGRIIVFSYNETVLSSTSGKRFTLKDVHTSLEEMGSFSVIASTLEQSLLAGSVFGYNLKAGDGLHVSWKGQYFSDLLPPRVYLLNDYQFHGWDYSRKFLGLDPASRGWLLRNDSWETTLCYTVTTADKYYVIIDNPNWNPSILPPQLDLVYYDAFLDDSSARQTIVATSPLEVTGNYTTQFETTFSVVGVGSDFTGTVIIIDGTGYALSTIPPSFWRDNDSVQTFTFQSPLLVTPNAKQYVWTNTSGLSTLQSGSITVTGSGSITGNYKTQYYLTVTSPYDSPTPTTGWVDSGTSVIASVTSPATGSSGIQHVCTGWSGTGSVPLSGAGSSTTFTLNQPSSIIWNWKTQYYLTVKTDPLGIATISGEGWYDLASSVTLTAPAVQNYTFGYWDVDGANQGNGTNPITTTMNAAHVATAHYVYSTPLTVHIQPTSATINLGQSVAFTSTVQGGTPLYTYQWYVDGNQASGATSNGWIFTPLTTGIHYVYLQVTDSSNNTAQSETARIVVTSTPVGGYSFSFDKHIMVKTLTLNFALVIGLALFLVAFKRKTTKRRD